MSLSLTKRVSNGAPLTTAQHDANLTAIESAVNATDATAATLATTVTGKADTSGFEAAVAGKYQVKWENVTEKPSTSSLLYCFRGQSSVDQTPSVVTTATTKVQLNSEGIDDDSIFDPSAYEVTIAQDGRYQLNFSVEVNYTSGTSTGLGARAVLRVNGTNFLDCEDIITSSGSAIVLATGGLFTLAENDVLDLAVVFTSAGTTVFTIQGIPNSTFFSGYLVKAT